MTIDENRDGTNRKPEGTTGALMRISEYETKRHGGRKPPLFLRGDQSGK